MIKIYCLKLPRNLKELHPQNKGINHRLMNMKLIKIFLKKIIYFKLKIKEVNHKFLQIKFKLRWNRAFKDFDKHLKNIKKFLYLLTTMLL